MEIISGQRRCVACNVLLHPIHEVNLVLISRPLLFKRGRQIIHVQRAQRSITLLKKCIYKSENRGKVVTKQSMLIFCHFYKAPKQTYLFSYKKKIYFLISLLCKSHRKTNGGFFFCEYPFSLNAPKFPTQRIMVYLT